MTRRDNNTTSVSYMLMSLGWSSSKQRSVEARLTMIYNMHALVATQLKDHLTHSTRNEKLLKFQPKHITSQVLVPAMYTPTMAILSIECD